MSFSYDSSCLIPLVNQADERHAVTSADFDRRLRAGQPFVLVPHCLLETFSYLTGVPVPYRIAPARAIPLLMQVAKLAGSSSSFTVDLAFSVMESVRRAGRAGGAIYDAHIIQLAQLAGVSEFVTWNPRDFEPYANEGLLVLTPQ